jgi:hypothetical protein
MSCSPKYSHFYQHTGHVLCARSVGENIARNADFDARHHQDICGAVGRNGYRISRRIFCPTLIHLKICVLGNDSSWFALFSSPLSIYSHCAARAVMTAQQSANVPISSSFSSSTSTGTGSGDGSISASASASIDSGGNGSGSGSGSGNGSGSDSGMVDIDVEVGALRPRHVREALRRLREKPTSLAAGAVRTRSLFKHAL